MEFAGFGTVSDKVHLVPVTVPGAATAYRYRKGCIRFDHGDPENETEDEKAKAAARVDHKGIVALNPATKDTFFAFPCLPMGCRLLYEPPTPDPNRITMAKWRKDNGEDPLPWELTDSMPWDGTVFLKDALPEGVTPGTKAEHNATPLCVESGRRSAMAVVTNEAQQGVPPWRRVGQGVKVYRLKGSGDIEQGFHCIAANKDYGPIAKQRIEEIQDGAGTEGGDKSVVTVRGQGWMQTTLRELEINANVEELMTAAWPRAFTDFIGRSTEPNHPLPSQVAEPTASAMLSRLANMSFPRYRPSMVSVGFWTYEGGIDTILRAEPVTASSLNADQGEKKHDPLKEELEDIVPVCGVYEANGERRLESHLLRGLERYWKTIAVADAGAIASLTKTIMDVAPAERKDGDSAVTDTAMQFFMRPDLLELHGAESNPVDENFFTVTKLAEALKPLKPLDNDRAPPADQAGLAEAARDLLVCLAVADQAGFETGVALRTMHLNDLSWGTYDDALGTHCNGHSNNMVVLSSFLTADITNFRERCLHVDEAKALKAAGESWLSRYHQIVAPLDFDMAYYLEEAKHGKHRGDAKAIEGLKEKFGEYLHMERQSMALCLGRMEGANSGAEDLEDFSDCPSLMPLVIALRDVTCVGYTEGLRGVVRQQGIGGGKEQMDFARAQKIVKEALKLTHDVRA